MAENFETEQETSKRGDDACDLLAVLDSSTLAFGQVIRILKENWKGIFAITFLATAIEAILEFIFVLCTSGFGQYNYNMGYGTHLYFSHYFSIDRTTQEKSLHFYSNLTNHHPATVCLMVVSSVIVYVTVCLAMGAVVQTVAEMYAVQPQSTTKNTLEVTGRKGGPLICTCLLISFVKKVWAAIVQLMGIPVYTHFDARVLGIFVALTILLGTLVTLFTQFMVPIVMVENKGAIESVPRSFRLLQGNIGTAFFIIVLYQVLRMPFGMLLSWVQWMVFGSVVGGFFLMLLCYAVNALFLAINTLVATVIYFHIRAKDDNLVIETLQEEMGLAGGGGSYTNMDSEKADTPVLDGNVEDSNNPDTYSKMNDDEKADPEKTDALVEGEKEIV